MTATADHLRALLRASAQDLSALKVERLALFGSAARGEQREDSDIDLLVDFKPDSGASLLDLFAVGHLVEELTGKSVDVATRDGLSPHVRDHVLRDCVRVY